LDIIGQIPDVYKKNQKLEEQGCVRQRQLDKEKLEGGSSKATWDKLRKERDFHKMHHHRVHQEKEKLNKDIEKLKSLHTVYKQKYQELSTKYEAVRKKRCSSGWKEIDCTPRQRPSIKV
jgi:predicted transcriptional regulator